MALFNDRCCLTLPVDDYDHCQGQSTAKVTLVEYGDYQCLACGEAYRVIRTIQYELGDQLRFVFRHFPKSYIAAEDCHAAEAAEAAASQGKFWEMHNYLFENQSNLADSHLVEYAIALYLNVDQFLQEVTSDCHVSRVRANIQSGMKSGVIKTPTFFINGVKYCGDHNLTDFLSVIRQVIGLSDS